MKNHHYDDDQVYKTDRWSRYLWQRFLDENSHGTEIEQRGIRKVYSFARFMRELFQRLYANNPNQVSTSKPEDLWAVKAHEELSSLPDFDRLRQRCRGDRLLAGEAALALAEGVLERLPEPQEMLTDPEPMRQKMQELLDFAQKKKPKTHDEDKDKGDGQPNTKAMHLDAMKARGQQAVLAARTFAESMKSSELRTSLRSAISTGHKISEEIQTSVHAFTGWGQKAASMQQMSADLRESLARQIRKSPHLQAIARQAGRLRRIAAIKQRSRADHMRDEVCDIELGADLGRVLPVELAKLSHPLLRWDFARRMQEGSLLQYKLHGKERQGLGPIVVCLDQSSSMQGDRDYWAKGMALALLELATMQRRSCQIVQFAKRVIRSDTWLAGKVSSRELLDSMNAVANGGTAFEPPLRSAMTTIEQESEFKKADIVLITDGHAPLNDGFIQEWKAAKKRRAFSCYAVHVDNPQGLVPYSLEQIANKVLSLSDVADDLAAIEILLNI